MKVARFCLWLERLWGLEGSGSRLSTHLPKSCLGHTSFSASQVSMTSSVVSSPSTVRVLSYTSSVTEGRAGSQEEGGPGEGVAPLPLFMVTAPPLLLREVFTTLM